MCANGHALDIIESKFSCRRESGCERSGMVSGFFYRILVLRGRCENYVFKLPIWTNTNELRESLIINV